MARFRKIRKFQYMPPTRGGNPNSLSRSVKNARRMFQYMPPTRGGNREAWLRGKDIDAFQYMPPTRGGNVQWGGGGGMV